MEVAADSHNGITKFFKGYDKVLCEYFCKYIDMSPFNIIELLPTARQGFLSVEAMGDLLEIKKLSSCNKIICPKLGKGLIVEYNREIVYQMTEEHTVISLVKSLLLNGSLNKSWTVYDFCYVISSLEFLDYYEPSKDYMKTLINFAHRALLHTKVNPLFISVILKEEDNIRKYFRDERSSKFPIYRFCFTGGLEVPDIIKNEIIEKMFLCKNLPINKDLSYYIISLEIF